jgi:hypothetical protein
VNPKPGFAASKGSTGASRALGNQERTMAHQNTPVRLAALALSAVLVTGSIAGLFGYSNAKYADALEAARIEPVPQTTRTAGAPLRIEVVGRRVAA